MSYKNLSKQVEPKKALEALKKVKSIKEGDSEVKKGVDLNAMAKELAQRRLDSENESSDEE